ncbi:Glutamine transport ATP-binding protein GlnQ [Raoultella ornithinolytica]|nr:Glutamine transport ATP-binding protein GlnQ [Raoultella ornithinolytica]
MIEFKNVSKHFGPTKVLHDIDLKINKGEVVVIIGPSGSGKSTLLRCINKLEEITSGELIVDGLKVNDPKVDERLIRQEAGMVFQQFYLFPHLTALENVMFGPLRVRGAKKEAAEKLAKDLLEKVGTRRTRAPLPFRALRRPAAARRNRSRPGGKTQNDAV